MVINLDVINLTGQQQRSAASRIASRCSGGLLRR